VKDTYPVSVVVVAVQVWSSQAAGQQVERAKRMTKRTASVAVGDLNGNVVVPECEVGEVENAPVET